MLTPDQVSFRISITAEFVSIRLLLSRDHFVACVHTIHQHEPSFEPQKLQYMLGRYIQLKRLETETAKDETIKDSTLKKTEALENDKVDLDKQQERLKVIRPPDRYTHIPRHLDG